MKPKPNLSNDFAAFSSDSSVRHEELLDCFGQHLFWCRSQALSFTRQAVSSPELRQRLGRIQAQPFEQIANLSNSTQDAAVELARTCTDQFIKLMLALLTSTGTDNHLEPDHAVRYKLLMEVIQKQTPDHVLHDEVLNRGGQKAFCDYFGRWLRQHYAPNKAV